MTTPKAPQSIDGLIPTATGELLRKLAGQVQPGCAVVEIGAYLGRSTCFLASGAKPGVPVYSIDPHGLEGSERGRGGRFAGDDVREKYLANIAGYDAVIPIRALGSMAPLPDEPVGLLWIDGAHDLLSVAADVARYAHLVTPGGHIVFDDFGTFHPGVDAVVRELCKIRVWTGWRFEPKPLAWARRA